MTVIQGWADTGKLYTSGKLSSSLIECICQDKYGYLWIGTEYGLNKFDGYRFSTYIYEKDDTTSIVDNEDVYGLAAVKDLPDTTTKVVGL